MSTGGALTRCVSVGRATFADRYWDRAPLLSPALADHTALLSLTDVDELLSVRGLRTPFVRMAKDGQVIPPARYTGSGGPGAEIPDQVRDDRVLELLAGGATLVLQGLHRLWPPLVMFADDLRAELGTPVQINAYLTPPGSQGFATHYDTHAVFVLQSTGRKHWRIHPPVVTDPAERQPWGGHTAEVTAAAAGAPELDTVLGPGDALYLPRGWLHSASTTDEWSLHLTIGLRAPTGLDLVDALLGLAAGEPALRPGLPMGLDVTDGAALAPAFADTVKALHEWLDTVTPDDLADALRRATWPGVRPAPLRPVAQAAALATLTADTIVTARPGLPLRLEPAPTGDGVVLLMPDKTIALPASCGAALRTVLDGRAHRIGDLPGLDDADRIVLTRRLLREAALVVREPTGS